MNDFFKTVFAVICVLCLITGVGALLSGDIGIAIILLGIFGLIYGGTTASKNNSDSM